MEGEWRPITDAELEKQFVELEDVERPEGIFSAVAVLYDEERRRVVVEFRNGCLFAFPPGLAQGLGAASPAELHEGRVLVGGETLRWDRLDVDLSVEGLLRFLFGTEAWMKHLGRAGGQTTSTAKAAAARLNGLKGGRPRKQSGDIAEGERQRSSRKGMTLAAAANRARKKTTGSTQGRTAAKRRSDGATAKSRGKGANNA